MTESRKLARIFLFTNWTHDLISMLNFSFVFLSFNYERISSWSPWHTWLYHPLTHNGIWERQGTRDLGSTFWSVRLVDAPLFTFCWQSQITLKEDLAQTCWLAHLAPLFDALVTGKFPSFIIFNCCMDCSPNTYRHKLNKLYKLRFLNFLIHQVLIQAIQ